MLLACQTMRDWLALAMVSMAMLVVGCGRTKPAPPSPVPQAPPAITEASVQPPRAPGTATQEQDEAAPQADEATADPEDGNASTSTESPPPEIAAEPVHSRERLILLAPHGPLIVEFQLTIDGRPHDLALEQLVDEVLELADSDGDGRPMWTELCAQRRIKYGQYGNLPIEGDNGEKQIVERYDINRNGIVDRTELPRFLTRNAGGSRSFSIRGTADYRGLNRRGAPTWQAIDADGDGVISPEERDGASGRLASRDMNDDEILLAADLNPRLELMEMGMMTQRRRRGPDAARMLGPHADWGGVRLALENQYGGGRILRSDCFPLTPELFALLDENGDERLMRDEFPRLNDVPPHVVVAVEFGSRESGVRSQESGDNGQEAESEEQEAGDSGQETATDRRGPKIQVVHVAEGLAESGQQVVEQSGRLTLRLAGMLLTLYTNDTVAAGDFEARAKQGLAMYDANKDGYLEASEVPEGVQMQFGRFEALDTDEDGKVYLGEIIAYLRQQQAGLRAQIHAKASDREDALFAVLDANHDERLDSRELEAAADRLAALDRDGDGLVSPDELPEAMVIGLARGSLENADALFTPPAAIVRTGEGDAPRWFTSMDANRDGAISPREFLGTSEQFASLDADGNGLIEAFEAKTASTDSAIPKP